MTPNLRFKRTPHLRFKSTPHRSVFYHFMVLIFFNPRKHASTLKIQKDSTPMIHKDSTQKCFLTHFMLQICFNPWNMTTHLRFKRKSHLRFKIILHRSLFYRISFYLYFFNPRKRENQKFQGCIIRLLALNVLIEKILQVYYFCNWQNSYNQSQEINRLVSIWYGPLL